MPLYDVWTDLCGQLDAVDTELLAFIRAKPSLSAHSDFLYSDECRLEGLVSRLWQSWCVFCRSCLMQSCLGTTDGNGTLVAAHLFANSEAEVSGAAIKAKSSSNATAVVWGGSNSIYRYEPTWGDPDLLVSKLVPRLAPSNQAQLLAAFSSVSHVVKPIQAIRNASAHLNSQSLAEVRAFRSKYVVFPITHPVHALFWIDPASRDYLISDSISKIIEGGLDAIS